MVNLLALSPVLLLLLGALAVMPSRALPHISSLIPFAALIVSLLLVLVNARQPNLVPYLFPAFASAPDLDLAFSFAPGGVFLAAAVLIAFLSLSVIELPNGQPQLETARLLTLSGVVAFFLSANWTTLAAAWLLTDMGILVWNLSGSDEPQSRGAAWRALATSQFGALVFLGAGALTLNSGSSLRFESATLVGLPADLVLVAAWMRSGLFPFHFGAAEDSRDISYRELEQSALTFLVGTFLIIRAVMMIQGELNYGSAIYTLALLAVGASALMGVGSATSGGTFAWTAFATGAPVLLIPFVAGPSARPSIVLWLALGLFNLTILGAGARRLSTNARHRPLRRVAWAAAILIAAGFPLTPAFLGRVGLYASSIAAGEGILVAALVAGTTLALLPLFRELLHSPLEGEMKPKLPEYFGLAVMLLPAIVEGMTPFVLVSFFGRQVEDGAAFAFDALYHARNVLGPTLLFGALLLPLPLAFIIERARTGATRPRGYAPQWIRRVLDLSALGRALVKVLDSVGLTARQVSALVEQHPLGWLLFAAFWLAVWLLNGLGGR
jgi:formate hydrogenlyase subunit 3/multisubunit Na+/H+ antiporter MnhD subunit